VHRGGFAGGELDAVAVFDEKLGLILADLAHLADCILKEVAFVATVTAEGRWTKENRHYRRCPYVAPCGSDCQRLAWVRQHNQLFVQSLLYCVQAWIGA
jgi:hypothetical protein